MNACNTVLAPYLEPVLLKARCKWQTPQAPPGPPGCGLHWLSTYCLAPSSASSPGPLSRCAAESDMLPRRLLEALCSAPSCTYSVEDGLTALQSFKKLTNDPTIPVGISREAWCEYIVQQHVSSLPCLQQHVSSWPCSASKHCWRSVLCSQLVSCCTRESSISKVGPFSQVPTGKVCSLLHRYHLMVHAQRVLHQFAGTGSLMAQRCLRFLLW